MRYLLDTHTLLWAARDQHRLSVRARAILKDGANEIIVSAVSAFEIATKVRLRKLEDPTSLLASFEANIVEQGFGMLPISVTHALRARGAFPNLTRIRSTAFWLRRRFLVTSWC